MSYPYSNTRTCFIKHDRSDLNVFFAVFLVSNQNKKQKIRIKIKINMSYSIPTYKNITTYLDGYLLFNAFSLVLFPKEGTK